ncbi:FGGY family carbohydrate kinase [Salinisphaera sp. SPP-AMP-43]|uniref:FGGY-family carbohydrate kinase n=1 Tax=Salinisphaera sp. SPP-AMP-43 TaxID=3121288 RepID=UPI003C6E679C
MPKTHLNAERSTTYCGVDLGSTNMKVVLLSEDGTVVRRECRPTPRADDLALDADQILESVERLIILACGDRFCVHSIAVAGIGEDGVLLDADLEPLGPVLTWFDPRRIGLFESIRPRLADLPDTGTPLDAARTVVGWAWAMGQPGAARARTWVALTDYPAVRWSGAPFMSDTLAARTAAWSVTRQIWHDRNVEATLGKAERLPPVKPAGSVLGPVQSARLQAAGVLHSNAVVVAGGHDHPVGAWGVSQLDAQAVLDSMGTAEVVVGQSSHSSLPASKHLDIAAGITHRGLTLLSVTELARNIEWASQEIDVAAWIKRIAAGDQLPDEYLHSDLFEPGGTGGGQPRYRSERPIAPLSKASAVLGALARRGRDAVATVSSRMCGPVSVYAAGGWSRAPGWMALKGQCLETPVQTIPEQEVTAVGAAMLAAWACDVALAPERSLSFDAAGR